MACIQCGRDHDPYSCSSCDLPDRNFPEEFIVTFSATQRNNSINLPRFRLGASPTYQCLSDGCARVENCQVCTTYNGSYILYRSAIDKPWIYQGNLSESLYRHCGSITPRKPTIQVILSGLNTTDAPTFASSVCPYPSNIIRLRFNASNLAYTCVDVNTGLSLVVPDISIVYTFPSFELFNEDGDNIFKLLEINDPIGCLCEFPATVTVSAL